MNHACPYCTRPLAPMTGVTIGPVRFCDTDCIRDWFSLPQHDRRRQQTRIVWERRAS